MPTDTTVIPPVDTGDREHSLDVEYKSRAGRYHWRARGTHAWTFNGRAYYDATDLDEGSDYPYVGQANGHRLAVVRDFRHVDAASLANPQSGDTIAVFVEEDGVRGTTSYEYFWSLEGSYTLEYGTVEDTDDVWQVTDNRTDSDEEHASLPHLTGNYYESPDAFVRQFHTGAIATVPTPDELYARLLQADTPDDAITVSEYHSQHGDAATTPADD
jgi:hypothetical protein